jgi:hypothetical protein
MFEQVGHASLAVRLVARADQIGDIHRDGGLGLVGEQQHGEPVGEAVLGDALHFGNLLGRGWSGGQRGAGEQEQEQGAGELITSNAVSVSLRGNQVVGTGIGTGLSCDSSQSTASGTRSTPM